MRIVIAPIKIFKLLIVVFIFLLIGNIFSIYLQLIYNFSKSRTAVRLLNFNIEQNIPTLFSFLILLISGLLLCFIAENYKNRKSDYKTWNILGYIFLFLSIDEAVSIHETFTHILNSTFAFDLKGYLFYSWVIPYGIILILLIVYLFNFLRTLPPNTLKLFIASGIIYIIGAIGIEIIGSKVVSDIGKIPEFNFKYSILYTIEESFEMIGIIIFIYALLKYILINNFKPLEITISK